MACKKGWKLTYLKQRGVQIWPLKLYPDIIILVRIKVVGKTDTRRCWGQIHLRFGYVQQEVAWHNLNIYSRHVAVSFLFFNITTIYYVIQSTQLYNLNLLTRNDHYRGRTAPLNSKLFTLYIYSTNIGTEYFKHGIYSPFFSLQNAVRFIILTCLVPVLFTFYIQDEIWKWSLGTEEKRGTTFRSSTDEIFWDTYLE